MAYTNFGIGMIIATQGGGAGVVNATVRDRVSGGGTILTADGAILGDASAGIGSSGIDLGLGRKFRDLADLTGSFTKQFSTFLLHEVKKFTVTTQMRGSGRAPAGTGIDDDCNLATYFHAKNALLGAAGFTGVLLPSTPVGWRYKPTSAVPCTAKIWIGSGTSTYAIVLYDLYADLTISAEPGNVGIETWDLKGLVYSTNSTETFPTFDYQLQSSISAPVVELAAHSWGAGAVARGFESMSIKVANSITDTKDSNVAGGIAKKQTAREITMDANIYTESTAEAYDYDRIKATVAGSDVATFAVVPWVGGVAQYVSIGAGIPQLAYKITLNCPDHLDAVPTKIGGNNGVKVSARATAAATDTEMYIDFM